jgi:hypothetical protein
LFTTGLLASWYRHIALADTELRREFDYMVAAGFTPEQYGLRVRTHPGGMTVTALNKMCHSQRLELSWAGVLVQSTQLPKDERRIGENLKATEHLLSALPTPERVGAHETRIWRNVEATKVANFMEALQLPPQSARASGRQIAAFIRQQAAKPEPELTHWTVALISVGQGQRIQIAGHDIGLVKRSAEHQTGDSFGLRKANILSPADEGYDFQEQAFTQEWFDGIADKPELAADLDWLKEQVGDHDARNVALELTSKWQQTVPPKLRLRETGDSKPKRPNGRVLRLLRRRSHGLLLIYPLQPPTVVEGENRMPDSPTGMVETGDPVIGVAVSFPTSDTVLGVEYRVNRVWDAEIQEDSTYDD